MKKTYMALIWMTTLSFMVLPVVILLDLWVNTDWSNALVGSVITVFFWGLLSALMLRLTDTHE